MTEVLQFHTPCGAITSVETDREAFKTTKAFAQGAVFGCRMCNSSCTLWKIANLTETYEDFLALLSVQGKLQNTDHDQSSSLTI